MNTSSNAEYQKLALDSSNDMIDHDADRTLGRYPKAAWHIRNAGIGRLRMGQMKFDEGDYTQAAADWLSAAACFYLASDPKALRVPLDRVRQLDQEGRIPPERRDIHAALKERKEQIKTLEQKLSQFQQDYNRLAGSPRTSSREALDFLCKQVSELPGSPKLHAEIYHQAQQLGAMRLAVEHLDWAQNFDPKSPVLGTLRMSLWIAAGEAERAVQLGRELLTAHPGHDSVRIMLAQAMASQTDARRMDWEEAIETLRPITETLSVDPEKRLLALSLAAILQHGLGHETEYHRLLDSFNQAAQSLSADREQRVVSEVRRVLPHVFPQPGSNGATTSEKAAHQSAAGLDYSAVRHFGELFNLSAA